MQVKLTQAAGKVFSVGKKKDIHCSTDFHYLDVHPFQADEFIVSGTTNDRNWIENTERKFHVDPQKAD